MERETDVRRVRDATGDGLVADCGCDASSDGTNDAVVAPLASDGTIPSFATVADSLSVAEMTANQVTVRVSGPEWTTRSDFCAPIRSVRWKFVSAMWPNIRMTPTAISLDPMHGRNLVRAKRR